MIQDSERCTGTTQSGERCKHKATHGYVAGQRMCILHFRKVFRAKLHNLFLGAKGKKHE